MRHWMNMSEPSRLSWAVDVEVSVNEKSLINCFTMYSQLLIRCYTSELNLPKGFEDLTDDVPNMWVCEPVGSFRSVDDAHAWIQVQLSGFEQFQLKRGFDFKLVVFIEIGSELAPFLTTLDKDLIAVFSRLEADVELFVTE